jgi:hypothetical protein
VVDNATTTSGAFARYVAEVRRFSLTTGSKTWADGTGYGPYEEAIASYLYQPNSLNLPLETSSSVQFTMIDDLSVTQTNKATVDAYSTIDTLEQAYDRFKSWFVDNLATTWGTFGVQKITIAGDTVQCGDIAITINPSAASAFVANAGANTLVLKSSDYTTGINVTKHSSTGGSLALLNGALLSTDVILNNANLIGQDIDNITGVITMLGTSRLDVTGEGLYPPITVNATSKIRVTTATSGDTHDCSAVVFNAASVFENTSGQPINVALQVGQIPPVKLQTSGTITFITPIVTIDVTAPNLLDNSRVRLYNVTQAAEIDNTVVAGGSGYTITLEEGVEYDSGNTLVLLATFQSAGVAKRVFRGSATATTTNISFNDTQTDWTEHNLIGIDGSTVSECTTDFLNIQVDVNDADNTTNKDRIAAFIVDSLTSAEGIRNWVSLSGSAVIDYLNAGSAIIDFAVATLKIDNVKTTPLDIVDAFKLRSSTGVSLVDDSTYTINFDNTSDAVVVETGVSGLTPTESDTLSKIDALTEDVSGVRFTAKALEEGGSGGGSYDDTILQAKVDDILADTNELQTNQGDWTTATGFATPADVPTTAQIEAALLNEGDGQQLIDAIVQAIDNENINQTVLIAAIRSDLERSGGLLDNLPVLSEIESSSILAKTSNIDGLNNLSISQVQTIIDGLNDPTVAQIVSGVEASSVIAKTSEINALNNISAAEVNAQVDTALNNYDVPTKAEIDSAFTEIKGAGWSTETLRDIRENAGGGLNEAELHDALDSYSNKSGYQSDVSQIETDLTAVKAKTDQFNFTNNTVDANTGVAFISADTCKVTLLIYTANDLPIDVDELFSETGAIYAELDQTYYDSSTTKYFATNREKPSYDKSRGEAFWILPQGASVKFFIKQLSINSTVTIPASSTATLNALLSA